MSVRLDLIRGLAPSSAVLQSFCSGFLTSYLFRVGKSGWRLCLDKAISATVPGAPLGRVLPACVFNFSG